ncbi:flagellar hook assembly protein FlgD [Rhizobium sp. BK251]|uniref:flagellar hook assembly protein FlgD n=1 Tax=Rhizobium sp. BK251 TaxID=2512125 RepID=UPI00104F6E71|nr:flagellar hook assembly protein FlgD [Rhizobium sp. BK251]TCL75645.1 flagellar basal-body rod modification protein FlgD [Rhizobium sp. BK251]
MAVDPIGSSTSTNKSSSSSPAASAASMNYNSFLKLLIAQMKTQDPTDPMDASEQVAQLATFSQVEQTIQTNSKLDTILQSQTLTQAATYIGQTMTSADGTISGVVESVKVYSDGLIATTKDGKNILIQPGITIGTPPASETPDDGGESSSA